MVWEKEREETIRLWGKNRREAKLLLIRSFVYPLSIAINLFERLSLSVQTEFLYELLCYSIFAACTYSASIYFMEMIRTSSASQDDARGRVNNTNTKFYLSIFNSHKIQLRPSSYSRKLFQAESNFQWHDFVWSFEVYMEFHWMFWIPWTLSQSTQQLFGRLVRCKCDVVRKPTKNSRIDEHRTELEHLDTANGHQMRAPLCSGMWCPI